ncbi:MAG: ATP-binding protein [Calditrichia bacterium]
MKTIYKKALIIGAASILLEGIIIFFLYTSINAFYADLTNKLAFLLVEQVKNVIETDRLDLAKLSPYNKYPTRRLMNRFSGDNSKILHILLIDTTNNIVVSDDPSVEGKQYTSRRELQLLNTDHPTIVDRTWEGNQEILDVIMPIIQDSVKQGYLRTVISVNHLQNFYQNRKVVLLFASIFSLGIIILIVLTTSGIYKSNLEDIGTALEKLQQSDFNYRVNYQKQDEFTPLFTRLNELFEKTIDMNASFRQSEERINAMMKVIHEGLMIVNANMKIISYNDYLLDIFHIRNPKAPEEKIYQILQKNPKLLEIYRRARDPLTHAVRKTMAISLLDDSTIDIQINALSILEGENTNSVIFYVKNLGLIKELEQNLNRSMRYTIISQLASSVGHEIRNPLSSLAIHTEVLDDLVAQIPTDKDKSQKIKKSLKILNSEITRISKLTDQFFNLAKPKEVELGLENINSIIKDIATLVQQEAYEKAVNLKLQLTKDLKSVNMIRDQIKQVILNIVLNAFDSMPNGGTLYLITREVENNVVIIIKDSGSGIPEEIRDKIFDLYFSTKSTGGGIGLAISKKIIEAHEGKLYFKTKINAGTSFIIELPKS